MHRLSNLLHNPIVDHVARIAGDAGVPVYLVGGAVRDALRGTTAAYDFDFALYAGFDKVVASFARARRGTVIPWDINQTRIVFRQGHARVSVDFARMQQPDIESDLRIRDFTVNAMAVALHAADAGLIDPMGGLVDLEAGCLRMCTAGAFEADPVRMLRAIRFARRLSCAIETETRAGLRRHSALITRSARERIKRELFMILHGPGQETSLRDLLDTDLLFRLLPDMRVLEGVPQSPPHEHMLLEHSLLTVRYLEDVLRTCDGELVTVAQQLTDYVCMSFEEGVSMVSLLMFAALLHDIGKPTCAFETGGRIRFHGHDAVGADSIRRMAQDIGLGRRARQILGCLAGNHMRILQLSQLEHPSERAKIRFLRDCGTAAAGVCLLAIADSMATGSLPEYRQSDGRIRQTARELCVRVLAAGDETESEPLLSGSDVMTVLGIEPGPPVGDVLRQAARLECDGLLHDRESALTWLRSQRLDD